MHEMLRSYLNDMTSSTISDEEFKYVEEAFVPKSMRKRQYLLHEGSVCKYIAFIVKGAMRLYSINDKGNEHIVRFGIEGWWMSDRESFMMLTPSKFNIDALEDCQLLLTTKEQLANLQERSPLFFKMAHILDGRHSIAAQHRVQSTISYSAEEKVADLMNTYPEFLRRFPQTMLASYLGLTPETYSRVRKQILAK